jgi:succinate-semialdehyde dehydrogenase/glutarate-semialdehyde dehydrogenase
MAASIRPAAQRPVESVDPATGQLWKRFETCSAATVFEAVRRAKTAQRDWASQPVGARVRVLRRFHESLFRRRREVAAALTRENGKPVAEAIGSEVAIALDFANYYAREAPRFLHAPWFNAGSLAMKRKRVRVAHEPFGVIGVISPWNYPFMLSAGVVIPALVTGNAVLLKPSEFTPESGEILRSLLTDAGIPRDVFTVLQGDGSTGAALCDSAVEKIFFTGSVQTGRRVAVKCAERLVPCALELGGSDAAIVLADANVHHAASGIAWGRFSNAGQTCVAPKRIYVEAPAYDAFIAELGRVVRALKVGAGGVRETDVGPMIRGDAVAALESQRDEAVSRGAMVVATATAPSAASPGGGSFFAPTVLANVPADARVLREETFGPLLPVVRVQNADEAIALANASEFGLSASIWSADTARAARMAQRIEAGSVVINDAVVVAGMADVPHGGVKQSGIGRTHGRAGLEECVRTKATVIDRFASWRQAWWFGYSPQHDEGIDAYVRVAHSHSVIERLAALPKFMKFIFKPNRPV